MSPELQAGLRFEWTCRVPAHAVVPALYDVPTARDMPPVLATGYLVGILERGHARAHRGRRRDLHGTHRAQARWLSR